MTCEGCYNLKDLKCIINKDHIVGPISNGQVLLNHKAPCIFKNTQYPNMELPILEKLAMTRVSIDGYYIAENMSDIKNFFQLVSKENIDDLLARFVLIMTSMFMSISELKKISDLLKDMSKGRLWNIVVKMENDISIKELCLENLKLPFNIQLTSESDYNNISKFREHIMNNFVPISFGNIFNTQVLRDTYYANKEKSILQHNSKK